MRGRGDDIRGLVEALLRDAEFRKMHTPRVEAATRARNAFLSPLILPSYGALGARATAYLKQVFGFVKKEGRLGMRSSHPRRASTWYSSWFSDFWRISMAATAKSAAFLDRALRTDQVAAFEGPRSRKPHFRFLRHCFYNLNHGRRQTQYRGRSQGRWSDGSRSDEWRTSRNSGVATSGVGATAAAA